MSNLNVKRELWHAGFAYVGLAGIETALFVLFAYLKFGEAAACAALVVCWCVIRVISIFKVWKEL